jgi:hypothetical protein
VDDTWFVFFKGTGWIFLLTLVGCVWLARNLVRYRREQKRRNSVVFKDGQIRMPPPPKRSRGRFSVQR